MIFKKWFNYSVDYLWKNRKKLAIKYKRIHNYYRERQVDHELSTDSIAYYSSEKYFAFDYPDYGGMDRRIAFKLSGDFVDVIQQNWDDLLNGRFKTKKQFIKMLLDTSCWNPITAVK